MYSILNNNLGGVYARKKIAFDTYNDLLIYDTKILKPGSIGIVLDTDTVYVFGTNRTWDKKENEGYATEEYVDNAVENAQGKTITDTDGYFTTDTVEGALSELGKEVIKREWYKLEYWIFNWYIANDASSGCRTIDFDAASALTGAPLALICLFLTNLQSWYKDRMKTDFLAEIVPAIEALKAANLITYPSAYDWKFVLYVKPDEYGYFQKSNGDYYISLKSSGYPGATLYAHIDVATGEYTDFYVSTDDLPISLPELKISDSKYANIVKNLKLDEKQDKISPTQLTLLNSISIAPTESGNYKLVCNVNNDGTITYSWVIDN